MSNMMVIFLVLWKTIWCFNEPENKTDLNKLQCQLISTFCNQELVKSPKNHVATQELYIQPKLS